MTAERASRKLAAILSADVKGYSRLMGEDELSTVATLKKYREVMTTLIQQYRGRVVDFPGDNLLAEFGSVVDAVECAVKIQQQLKNRNAKLPESRRMEFRIGVNLGDVLEDAERIYGDGVNVAARVEGLAEPGGISISGTAYDQVKNKLTLGYESLGEHTVKNIAEPVRVYRVLMEPEAAGKIIGEKRLGLRRWQWMALAAAVAVVVVAGAIWYFAFRPSYPPVEPASLERMAFPLPDKPSIAILPFVNMSGDPEQEYFSDGMTEEIINGLSKIPYMFVIARQSSFFYKGKPVKVQQVAEELGVRYVMEGSVRIVGDRVRVTAQLIDATTGRHLWSERYDRVLDDIFAIQDDITVNIMQAMQLKVAGLAFLEDRPTSLEAYVKILKGIEHAYRWTKDDNAFARKLFEEAIALDPDYGPAYSFLGWRHVQAAFFGWSDSPSESLEKAEELAQKALSLGDDMVYMLFGEIHTRKGEFDKALAASEKDVALNPNNADSKAALASRLKNVRRHQEAIAMIEEAIRLNPHHPNWYLWVLGQIYVDAERYEEAIAALKKFLELAPDNLWGHLSLTVCYGILHREEEAREAAKEVLRIDPKFSIGKYAPKIAIADQEYRKRWLDAWRKAGLPD